MSEVCVCVCSITVGVVVRSIVLAALSSVSRWLVMSPISLSLCCSSICSSILVVVTCPRCVCVCSITVGVVVRSIVLAALSGVSHWLVVSLSACPSVVVVFVVVF